MKAFDREGRVLYMGSFSKILAPGVRTGYLVGAKPVIDRLTTLKSACDVHSNSLGQLICKRFLEEVDLGAHLERLRSIYRARCGQMLRALEREFDPVCAGHGRRAGSSSGARCRRRTRCPLSSGRRRKGCWWCPAPGSCRSRTR